MAVPTTTQCNNLVQPSHPDPAAPCPLQVRAALGIRKTVVSGGGSLPPHLDDFFEAAGLTVLVGYGLTETAPVLSCRRWALGALVGWFGAGGWAP